MEFIFLDCFEVKLLVFYFYICLFIVVDRKWDISGCVFIFLMKMNFGMNMFNKYGDVFFF